LPDLKSEISELGSKMFLNLYEKFDVLEDICDLIERSIVDEPPISVKEGGIIKHGFSTELDEIKEISTNGKDWISRLQGEEREKTGIKNLKIGFTKVFGYYLEVTQSNLKDVPDHYIRKQTLANCERYVTPELKEMEAKILNAEEQVTKIEYDIFIEIRQFIKERVKRIQETARCIAVIDTLNSLAIAAVRNDYVRPVMNDKGYIDIKDGRHPVIERIIKNEMFVPNDTYIDNKGNAMSIITGPNMAGKSTYMRQVALIALLAHIGSFVPAKSAEICILDKIFTRVGASDDLAQGQSTFMVEMSEVSYILSNATENSLLILDEIGRGTSTYDGLSIAWSVVEYISKKIKAKTLFATHYHELSELESKLKSVKNYRILIKEDNDKIIFLRKIAEGSVDRSDGIQVANLAGLPVEVVTRAKEILMQLDDSDINKPFAKRKKDRINDNFQVSIFSKDPDEEVKKKEYMELIDTITNIDINNLTPIKSLTLLSEIIEKSKHI
jgi:DNA mismatch repair protein MutS